MYFFIDETGHTGNNIVDKNQPYFYYGLLSCPKEITYESSSLINDLYKARNDVPIHTKKLRLKTICKIIPTIKEAKEQLNLEFNLCRINKVDHAIISFFDQV